MPVVNPIPTRFSNTRLIGALLLLLPLALAAPQALGKTVTTRFQAAFRDTVFLADAARPEWVTVSGTLHLVTRVTPSDPLIPTDPIRVAVHANVANAKGVGQLSGETYNAPIFQTAN